MSDPRRAVDTFARLAESWDHKGRRAMQVAEPHALCALAWLPLELSNRRWNDLTPEQRWRLVTAARRAVELGRLCAWFFGEGEGV